MTKVKEDYLKILTEYIDERLYITDKTHEIEKEIEINNWYIGGSFESIHSLNFNEWVSFMHLLIADRQTQLNDSGVDTDLIFYCWHDELTGQLRFNVISANHDKLPFRCQYEEDSLDNILKLFLRDEFNGFMPREFVTPISLDEADMLENEIENSVLKVFSVRLNKAK